MRSIRHIALLRGINIGGHQVKMEHLRELFRDLGFENVRSFIQTGNVFFETPAKDRTALTRKIEQHLYKALGYEVPTFLRTISEVETALGLNPFKHLKPTTDTRFLITFIQQSLPDDFKLPMVSPKNDFEILHATSGEVFILMRRVNGKSGNPAAFLEKQFKVKTTTRFFATTAKILEAAKDD